MWFRALALASLILLAACGKHPSPPPTEGVTDAMLLAAPEGEWLSYGSDYGEQRFSPLTQITDSNVKQLGLAWFADIETTRGQEATPLMHDGVLYVTTSWSLVKAYDARTGAPKWAYDPKVPRETLARACCDAVNRGVALYGDKAYVATLDGRLVALDQKTGKVVWSRVVVPNQQDYTITGAPRVAKGRIFIGAGGAEFKARGYLAAYDAQTGEELWKFHTVPGDPAFGFENPAMEQAAKTWRGEWWKLGGGGTVWEAITYDPKTNLVLFGTGNAEPWNPDSVGRTGDSLYTSSIVAVNADTGEYAWHFQETPEDRWDLDSTAQITIADLNIGGQMRHVALHAPKNGYFYVFDAKTGAFISAGSIVPQNWTTGIDPKTGKATVNPEARYEKTGKLFLGRPGGAGAHNWQSMSFSPRTGLVYIPTNQDVFPYGVDKNWKATSVGYQIGVDLAFLDAPSPKSPNASATSMTGPLIAWDPVTQKEAWRVDHPGAMNGGTLATAGNLVFQGTATGDVNAYGAEKGAKLWSFAAQAGVAAAPMSYAIGGEQYVAILAGYGGTSSNRSRLLVFKLGAKGTLPPATLAAVAKPAPPPPFTGTPEQVALGGNLYGRYCVVCHMGGYNNPLLKHSPVLSDAQAVRSIVIDGALKHNGMVSFAAALKPEDVEAIRQYVIKRANDERAQSGS